MTVLRDANGGREYPLTKSSLTLGRAGDCDLHLNVPSVSSRHALLLRSGEGWFLSDLGSSNGTFVNGQRIKQSTRLQSGDLIDLCGAQFHFLEGPASHSGRTLAFSLQEPAPKGPKPTVVQALDVAGRPEVSPEAKLRAILEMLRNLGTTLALTEILPKVLESLLNLFGQSDRGFVLLREQPGGPLLPKAVRHRNPFESGHLHLSRTIIDHVVQTGKAILSADAGQDERFDTSQSIRSHQIRSIMCVPLVGEDGANLGVIQLDTKGSKDQFRQEDLDVLVSASQLAARAVELARLHEVRRDLEAATAIQHSFLPADRPHVPGLKFFDHYQSAQQVGGDYYDYILLPGGRLGVALGDVAGKGVAAALLMARLSAGVRFCLATEPNLSAAVRQLNLTLMRACGDDRFITFVVGVIDVQTFASTWVNAGHLPPLLRRAGHVTLLGDDEVGIPLGIFDRPYEETKLQLEPGDAVLLYTDGVTEARNPRGDLYGPDRLATLLTKKPCDAEVLVSAVLADVKHFSTGRPPGDDLTMVCVNRE
ncbi:MAG: SpoIIE family protein phosphatase [Gemmataceae bacterium]